jgi:hypothetical protein
MTINSALYPEGYLKGFKIYLFIQMNPLRHEIKVLPIKISFDSNEKF